MDSKDKKKRPYEPPRVYELDVELSQAMGQTQCARGASASGSCSAGRGPTTTNCTNGQSASTQCAAGQTPGTSCGAGGTPTM
ncbi:MAG: hypothetical protein JRH06_05085 [Deltaproteobacteria bacterium]|nr:hypothetical protein [Deltaproteobacteria bacterium]MBW2136910.1 hypothetical protein [Deltaproteobacteria bacterium]